jgi:L-2-hydroxyglutarate oxidase LhgO
LSKPVDKVEVVIIGAGVVGLAVAAELSGRRPGGSIVLFEKNETFGRETSSRNSEVIHAGIYYPANSLKARLCVEGRALLYDFCNRWGIKYNRCGKLIVANNAQESASLDELLARAALNGVSDLQDLSTAQIKHLEPNIRAERALLSPSTGVIDSHGLMVRLEQIALQNAVMPAYRHTLTAIEPLSAGYRLYLKTPDGDTEVIDTEVLINSAGLHADHIAALSGIDTAAAGYRIYPCKGEYFSLPPSKAALVKHLIYPPPLHELTGLGFHATKSIDGRLRLGPNTIYLEREGKREGAAEDYSVDPSHAADFFRAVEPFMPFIEQADLEPEMAGIRPKLSAPGEPFRDFIIKEEKDRGLPGLINLIGIESPGLTAALSIARLTASLL